MYLYLHSSFFNFIYIYQLSNWLLYYSKLLFNLFYFFQKFIFVYLFFILLALLAFTHCTIVITICSNLKIGCNILFVHIHIYYLYSYFFIIYIQYVCMYMFLYKHTYCLFNFVYFKIFYSFIAGDIFSLFLIKLSWQSNCYCLFICLRVTVTRIYKMYGYICML